MRTRAPSAPVTFKRKRLREVSAAAPFVWIERFTSRLRVCFLPVSQSRMCHIYTRADEEIFISTRGGTRERKRGARVRRTRRIMKSRERGRRYGTCGSHVCALCPRAHTRPTRDAWVIKSLRYIDSFCTAQRTRGFLYESGIYTRSEVVIIWAASSRF